MVEVREGPIWFTRTTKWTRYRGGLNGPFPSEANIDGWRNKTSLTFSLIRHNLHPVTETQSGTVGAETFNCNHMWYWHQYSLIHHNKYQIHSFCHFVPYITKHNVTVVNNKLGLDQLIQSLNVDCFQITWVFTGEAVRPIRGEVCLGGRLVFTSSTSGADHLQRADVQMWYFFSIFKFN